MSSLALSSMMRAIAAAFVLAALSGACGNEPSPAEAPTTPVLEPLPADSPGV